MTRAAERASIVRDSLNALADASPGCRHNARLDSSELSRTRLRCVTFHLLRWSRETRRAPDGPPDLCARRRALPDVRRGVPEGSRNRVRADRALSARARAPEPAPRRVAAAGASAPAWGLAQDQRDPALLPRTQRALITDTAEISLSGFGDSCHGSDVRDLKIRNVPVDVKERRRIRAKRNGRSLSAETKAILAEAIERDTEDRRIARRLREMSRLSDS